MKGRESHLEPIPHQLDTSSCQSRAETREGLMLKPSLEGKNKNKGRGSMIKRVANKEAGLRC